MPNTKQASQLAEALFNLEAALRQNQLWESQTPSREALSSQEPFCLDTLSFTQWLQFIFIPKMREILTQKLPLPAACEISPMAEEYFRGLNLSVRDVMAALVAIDQVFKPDTACG